MPNVKSAILIAALALAPMPSLASPPGTTSDFRSATKARDIGGFRLGMHIREVNAIAKVTPIGGPQFDAEHDGKSYNFEVTPKGRVYRITSAQKLGRFVVDYDFSASLAAKLASKYGKPSSGSVDNFTWDLVENVPHRDGSVRPFKTNWMSAHVSHNGDIDDVSLEMTLLDFRIRWQDERDLNRAPRNEAVEAIDF